MTQKDILENISIVLHRPRISENIGATARAMMNMGLSSLIITEPQDYDREKALRTATHAASPIIENALFAEDLKTALSPMGCIACTTARTGRDRQQTHIPETAAPEILSFAKNNRVAILFGPEDRGLTNEEVMLADLLIRIPTTGFSSLNLSQAVLLLSYEINKAATKIPGSPFHPKLAVKQELEEMYSLMDGVFEQIGFTYPKNPGYWTDRFRKLFSRRTLQSKEVRMVRSLFSQIRTGKKQEPDDDQERMDNP